MWCNGVYAGANHTAHSPALFEPNVVVAPESINKHCQPYAIRARRLYDKRHRSVSLLPGTSCMPPCALWGLLASPGALMGPFPWDLLKPSGASWGLLSSSQSSLRFVWSRSVGT